ncbi:unnamed protein product, partial [Vitis vinifera]|uniref:Uncharacterized protein n=1 Tax=Vitis vinifera TaxID=29760 RepID=D7T0F8_VITVI
MATFHSSNLPPHFWLSGPTSYPFLSCLSPYGKCRRKHRFVTALDGLVNVNSLSTIAVFVGLSLTTPNQFSHENRAVCDAEIDVAKWLLVFEVGVDEAFRAHINLKALRFGM